MTNGEMIMWLLFAHFIGDWGTSNSWVGATKGKHMIVMLAHCMMYTAVCTLTIKLLGFDNIVSWAIWIWLSHICMDVWKSKFADPEKFPTWHLYLDQAFHIGVLLGILIMECKLI